jgi:hypothetical protein
MLGMLLFRALNWGFIYIEIKESLRLHLRATASPRRAIAAFWYPWDREFHYFVFNNLWIFQSGFDDGDGESGREPSSAAMLPSFRCHFNLSLLVAISTVQFMSSSMAAASWVIRGRVGFGLANACEEFNGFASPLDRDPGEDRNREEWRDWPYDGLNW